jgi:hypothetical protein
MIRSTQLPTKFCRGFFVLHPPLDGSTGHDDPFCEIPLFSCAVIDIDAKKQKYLVRYVRISLALFSLPLPLSSSVPSLSNGPAFGSPLFTD